MTIAHFAESVVVRSDGGTPTLLIWRGVRYDVTDTPTPIDEEVGGEILTHPIARRIGWRFQGTDSMGVSHVFDVREIGFGEWQLTTIYD